MGLSGGGLRCTNRYVAFCLALWSLFVANCCGRDVIGVLVRIKPCRRVSTLDHGSGDDVPGFILHISG
jgi:hypothetical protein